MEVSGQLRSGRFNSGASLRDPLVGKLAVLEVGLSAMAKRKLPALAANQTTMIKTVARHFTH